MWGRNLHKNMQRFLTFQLTVNVVICYSTILGSIWGHPPLNVLQMIWANLIMDILGAIALGTEKWVPVENKLSQTDMVDKAKELAESSGGNLKKMSTLVMKDLDDTMAMRIARSDPLIRPFMWQQVIVQATWQCIVMTVLMLFGGLMLGFETAPNLVTTPARLDKEKGSLGTETLIKDTFTFHVFILMNLFNAINCRVVSITELNMFATLHHNLIFLLILAIEFFVQQVMINNGNQKLTPIAAILGTGELTTNMNIVAYVIGACSLLVGVAAKKIPPNYFTFTENWTLE